MQILVRNFEGVTTSVEVESTQITVGNLRAKLLEKQVTDHGTSLTVERNHVTVDDIKLLVLRDQGVDIPKEETVLSWNESILRDGNKKLRDYKIKHKCLIWNRLLLEWEDPEGGATDDDDDDDEEEW